jgi:mRNA interferase RelE/StbE
MYELGFDKKALKFLNGLEHSIKKRIWNKLQECKLNPPRYLKRLTQIKGHKLRVGDYRLIIDIQEEIKVLFIEKIGHRKNIYDQSIQHIDD